MHIEEKQGIDLQGLIIYSYHTSYILLDVQYMLVKIICLIFNRCIILPPRLPVDCSCKQLIILQQVATRGII